jgi:hypothetical protein
MGRPTVSRALLDPPEAAMSPSPGFAPVSFVVGRTLKGSDQKCGAVKTSWF